MNDKIDVNVRAVGRVMMLTQFLYWVSTASTWANYSEMFIQRECDKRHVVPCHKDSKGYTASNDAAADFMTTFTLVMGIPALLTCSMIGVIGDTFGRKPALLIPFSGGLVFSAANALLPASVQHSWLIAAAALTALCGGQYASVHVSFAALADVTTGIDADVRTRYFGTVESAIWLGDVVGPTVGGWFVHWLGPQQSFMFSVVTYAVGIIVILCTFNETLPPSGRRPFAYVKANPLGSLALLARNATAFGFSCVVLCSLAMTSAGITMLTFYAEDTFGLGAVSIGYIMSTYFIANAVGLFFILPRLLRCARPKTIVALAAGWSAATWSLWAAAKEAWALYVLGASAVFSALFFPVTRSIVSSTFGPTQYGASLAALGTVQQITQMAAPPVATQLWHRVKRPAYLCVGGLGALGCIIALATPVHDKRLHADTVGAEAEADTREGVEQHSEPLLAGEAATDNGHDQ